MKKIAVLLLTAFFLPASLAAADFGLILNQDVSFGGVTDDDPSLNYEAAFIPRISWLLGDVSAKKFGEFVITAGMTVGIENDEFYYIPELLRTELSWRFGNAKITAGRMNYAAPFVWIADGLFDGFQFAYNSSAGTFNAGAWYTGLLYKKRANISMTSQDAKAYSATVDYGDFAATYFASRRMVAALGWEHPALAELVRTKLAFLAQADLNGRDDYLHSQYVAAKIGIPVNSFMFELSGALEIAEDSTSTSAVNIALAGEIGVFWILPSNFPSRLSFTGYFSSGKAEHGAVASFVPVMTKLFGDILEADPSGVSVLSLDYTVRLHKTFFAGLSSSYFIRSDLGTYSGYPLDMGDSEGFFLGNEFFARLTWSPVSDLQINLGGGIFLPSMGNAASGREPLWRIKLAAVLAIY